VPAAPDHPDATSTYREDLIDMATHTLHAALDSASTAAITAVSAVLFRLRDDTPGTHGIGRRLAAALGDFGDSGEVDPQLVAEVLDAPDAVRVVRSALLAARTPDSAALVDALAEELGAAHMLAVEASPPAPDTLPEGW